MSGLMIGVLYKQKIGCAVLLLLDSVIIISLAPTSGIWI